MIGQIFLLVFSQSKIFSGAFGASQFRPKNFFGASNNSGSPEGGSPPQPPTPLGPPPHPPFKQNSAYGTRLKDDPYRCSTGCLQITVVCFCWPAKSRVLTGARVGDDMGALLMRMRVRVCVAPAPGQSLHVPLSLRSCGLESQEIGCSLVAGNGECPWTGCPLLTSGRQLPPGMECAMVCPSSWSSGEAG